MVDFVTDTFLETLRYVLVEEVKFLSGMSDEVKKVERDLRTIHELLLDADRNRRDSLILRDCINELKELAIKAENILETYALEVESKKQGKSLKEKLRRLVGIFCECYNIHQVGTEIDDVRSRLADLTASLQSICGVGGESSSAAEEHQHLLRLRYAHETEQYFVGMGKDIHRLMSMVKDESGSVISICGMGGLGKTTLARKIYNHRDCQRRFDGRVWVCVTQQFQPEAVLRNIFKELHSQTKKADDLEFTELVVGIHNVLEQGRFLIVIDDIWENEHWKILKPAFPMNCKVVLTTRNENVAYEERLLHKLSFLSEDEGWELLAKIALSMFADAPPAVFDIKSKPFEDIGRHIVRKCGRLPLTISVIGGLLRQKQNLGEWKEVSSKIDSYLKHGEGIGNDTRVKLVLDLSYDALPYYLKSSFLYLACFPEDENIETEKLYLLWMSENVIFLEEKGDGECLRDVAERFLAELASRCMVLVQKNEMDFSHSRFTSCRLHDLMRDLCISKAKEEKFLAYIDISKHRHLVHSSIDASIHRLVINMDIDDDDDVAIRLSKNCVPEEFKDLRTLFMRCNGSSIPFQNFVNFENSKHLRILLLYSLAFEDGKLPSTMEKLSYLRYLSLNDCEVTELSEFVCELPYLQILDLSLYSPLKVPNLFWKMRRLRYLRLPYFIEVIGGEKLRVDGMTELETLIEIHSRTTCFAGITKLTNLLNLKATIDQDEDSLLEIAYYMNSNQCSLRQTELHVYNCDFGSGEEGRNIVKNMLMSPSLTYLHMAVCKMQCGFPCYEPGMCHNLTYLMFGQSQIGGDGDVLQELGKYPNLQYLSFARVEEQETRAEMKFGANSFPELRYLGLNDFPSMKKWEVEEGAIPKLNSLWLTRVNLEKLPDGLRFPSIEELRCVGMSNEFMLRTMEGGEDHVKFSHISKFVIE